MKGSFLILLLLITGRLPAQQCGYENYKAIIVKVIDKDTKQPIRGLKMYLSYENGTPIIQVGTNLKKKQVSGACKDTFLFWDNSSPEKIKEAHCTDTRLFRQSFPNAGDHYICVVPGYGGKNDLSNYSFYAGIREEDFMKADKDTANSILFRHLLINLTIEDTEGGRNGRQYNSQKIRIPVAAVTDICKNYLDSRSGLLNGEKLNPVIVELKANDALYRAHIKHDAFSNYLVPYYKRIIHPLNPEAEYTISQLVKIELYDERTASLLQTILPPRHKANGKIWKEGNMEFLNFYNDENNEKPGFRVPASHGQDNKEEKNVFCYYRYNPEVALYEEDTLLNNKMETRYDKDTRKMYATDWKDTGDYLVEYSYALQNKQWVLLQTHKHEKVKPDVLVIARSQGMCYIEVPDKVLPVQYFDSSNLKIIIDTFWLVNYGNTTAKIAQQYKEDKYFIFPSTIRPNQRLPIVYHREFIRENRFNNNLQEVRGPFDFISNALRLTVNNENELSLGISYMMIGRHAAVGKLPDGGLHFEIPYKEDQRFIVNTFPDKMWKEYGRIYALDSSRIGEWTMVDSSEKYLQKKVQYNKVLHIYLENAPIQDCRIINYYGWSIVENPKEYRGKIIVSPHLKSIFIYKDSLKVVYPLDFDEMQQEENVTLFLLKPGQDYFYSGKIKIPITPNYNRFVVRWTPDYEWGRGKPGPDGGKLWKKEYFNDILDNHPALSYDIDSGTHDFYTLDFSRCEEKEKKKIFSIIEKDANIASLGLMFYNGAKNFCDNKILLIDPANMKLDSTLMSRAASAGFKYKDIQASAGHYTYTFEYKSKIVGEEFLDAFNYMCETNKKRRFSLNMYMDIRPENPEDNLYKKRGGKFYD